MVLYIVPIFLILEQMMPIESKLAITRRAPFGNVGQNTVTAIVKMNLTNFHEEIVI